MDHLHKKYFSTHVAPAARNAAPDQRRSLLSMMVIEGNA
jgi:hypothetical protein